MINDLMKDKKYVCVYLGTPDNELSHTDTIIFSYLAYKDRYSNGEIPQYNIIAGGTGFDRNTVSNSIARLKNYGLVLNNRVCLPDMWRSNFLTNNQSGTHWSDSLRYRKSYVRKQTPENPLSVSCCSVLSYLWSKAEEGYTPRKGWSISYLHKVLKLNRETVAKCLQILEEHKFFRLDGWKLNGNLTDQQLSYFAGRNDHFETQTQNNVLEFVNFDDDDTPVNSSPIIKPNVVESAPGEFPPVHEIDDLLRSVAQEPTPQTTEEKYKDRAMKIMLSDPNQHLILNKKKHLKELIERLKNEDNSNSDEKQVPLHSC